MTQLTYFNECDELLMFKLTSTENIKNEMKVKLILMYEKNHKPINTHIIHNNLPDKMYNITETVIRNNSLYVKLTSK